MCGFVRENFCLAINALLTFDEIVKKNSSSIGKASAAFS